MNVWRRYEIAILGQLKILSVYKDDKKGEILLVSSSSSAGVGIMWKSKEEFLDEGVWSVGLMVPLRGSYQLTAEC